MIASSSIQDYDIIQKEKEAYLNIKQGSYQTAINLYQELIKTNPNHKSFYWYLGLAQMFQMQFQTAQATWEEGRKDGTPEEIETWLVELIDILKIQAQRFIEIKDYISNGIIWEQITILNQCRLDNIKNVSYYPNLTEDINKLLEIIKDSNDLEILQGNNLILIQTISLLKEKPSPEIVDSKLLLQALSNLLNKAIIYPTTLYFAQLSLEYAKPVEDFVIVLRAASNTVSQVFKNQLIAIKLINFCEELKPDDISILSRKSELLVVLGKFNEAIELSKKALVSDNKISKSQKIMLLFNLLKSLTISGGYWEEIIEGIEQQELLISQLTQEELQEFDLNTLYTLYYSLFYYPYIKDKPQTFHKLQYLLAKNYQLKIEETYQEEINKFNISNVKLKQENNFSQPLKIAYISHCLRTHSVGWLLRSLIKHHNRQNFEIYLYFVGGEIKPQDKVQKFYLDQKLDQIRIVEDNFIKIAEQIHQDQIDIAIDLDSLTKPSICAALSLKPAPLQISWLGWDNCEIPAIDYFIVDSYVLPEDAQSYYHNKLWRLPQNYIGLDGFEVDMPTLHREDLDISDDAIVYLTAQVGKKRNPQMARCQLQVIKNVPNSYLLIKGLSDQEKVKEFFLKMAELEEVAPERLRLLPMTKVETQHRANLTIADIILDTYPYTGATTTLEALWMGIPIVTRVGEQFSARNTYTMLRNVGVTEGITYNAQEYIECGIRLGTNSNLRDKIALQLIKARRTSNLWNGKKFAQDMENAYRQMWEKMISY